MATELRTKNFGVELAYNASGLANGAEANGPAFLASSAQLNNPPRVACRLFIGAPGSSRAEGANIQMWFRYNGETFPISRPPDVTWWLPADASAVTVRVMAVLPADVSGARVRNATGVALGSCAIELHAETDTGFQTSPIEVFSSGGA